MEFGSIVLVVQILLLVAGWLLFQQARSDLTARAAQMPVLSEVKALQKSVAALLEQMKLESVQTSAQLEARCMEARELLTALDRRLEGFRETAPAAVRQRAQTPAEPVESETPPLPAVNPRYQEVYTLADTGLTSSAIAQQTGLSIGEVDLILGLRAQTS